MAYDPVFTITPLLLSRVEEITALRERILGASVELSWIPALQKDTRTRNVHASTAIEGNPLTLEQVRALADGKELAAADPRSEREVTNYFAGLRFVEQHVGEARIGHEHLFELHRILAGEVMDQGEAGRYRTIGVKVGRHLPPASEDVSPLMFELLTWWNEKAPGISPILSSAILHYRFEHIHPFADGNGRTGRALALWELYRRGFDTHHIFSVDEYYWEDRPAYYAALDAVRLAGEDLSGWLEYCAEGLRQTLEKVWLRVQRLRVEAPTRMILSPAQERVLHLLRDHGSMAPAKLREVMDLSKQGLMNVLNPLIDAGLVEKVGPQRTGRYALTRL
ncbi:Fic family protein [Luteolibacter marinus]|uniref:Fic family protein n=1 Tax=Luteolibacter marinus TaxID=2776705 RepID=UPI0018662C4A|nr:Fic family protein [Luteolibacter marinus]